MGRCDFVGEASGGIPEFETRNLAHKLAGTSEERRKYYPQFGQQYFDTDVGKLLICTDPAKRKWVDAMGNAKERAGHRLGHLGGIACAGGRQSPIVFNGMEMLFSYGATHLFQWNGNVDVDWYEKHISMELKWLRLSVRRIGFNSIEIVGPLLRRILAYPVSLTS